MVQENPDDSRLIRGTDDLLSVFASAEKPSSAFRLGLEAEKFGVERTTGRPLNYAGDFGVARVLQTLATLGWAPERETPEGPLIALRRGGASVTLEPGSQLELSGGIHEDVHAVRDEFEAHLRELEPIAAEMNVVWLGVGFNPLALQTELDWVPKQRYAIMREYLPPLGSGALDMMRRTSTVQVNLDFSSEQDALRKLRPTLLLAPLINAMTANSPFVEGRRGNRLSRRGDVWLRMDPLRSGLVRTVLESKNPRYLDYAEWALDAGMFLFKRGDRLFANTGQPFREFLEHGYRGERATLADWKLHLNTLFPEVRLKNTLEVRMCDSLSARLTPSVPALFAGIYYDDRALAEFEDLARGVRLEDVEAARTELVTHALRARIGATPARSLAERIIDIAEGGLGRRARLDGAGLNESVYLAPLKALVARGQCPADRLVEGLVTDAPLPRYELIERTRIDA